jgi:uncharacterized SAM-binding protein YcdF (DUF218 family)
VPLSRLRDVQRETDPSGPVIVVLGYHEFGADGSHGISEICRAGVRRAEALAERAKPRAVIFTGWSSTGGPTEADQMAAAWQGRADVELIREANATNTAENAVRSLEVLRALDGARDVLVVCSVRHFPRARFFFDALYRRHGYQVGYAYVASPLPPAGLWRQEFGSITRMVRDRRAALGLLGEAPSVPTGALTDYG